MTKLKNRWVGAGFGAAVTALAGIHFSIPGAPNIVLHFDGGANFGIFDGNSDFNFGGTIGGLLGASIIYIF